MATVSVALRQVKARLGELVTHQEIFGICKEQGHVWRDRLLNPAVTVEIFLLQLLARVAMEGLRHAAGIDAAAAAICKAKMRLPLRVMMELVQRSVPAKPGPDQSLWKGLVVYLVDGMSFLVKDTQRLSVKFGKASNQRGVSSGYPVPKLLALMDFTGGFVRKAVALPWARQEYTCLSRLFGAIGRDGLLLGDRGLVSFAHLALLMNAGVQGCFRLSRGKVTYGRGKANRRRIKKLGKQDALVRWMPTRCPAWLSKQRWSGISQNPLILRQIAYRVCRKGFRAQWAWIITTLTDPQKYPAQDLIQLYSRRWQIEVYFRDLKRTLGLQIISAKTVAGVRKEILAFVLLYNLIRRVMTQAATQQNTTADRISFIDALRWLLWSSPGDPIPKLKTNPIRRRRSPPRRIKRGRHRFPQLHGTSREQSKSPCEVRL